MVDSALSPNSALPVEELRRALEWNLLPYQPEQYLERYVRRIDDVYGLMTLPSTNFVVGHLSRIVGDAAASGLRFRTLPALKVLRRIIRDGQPREQLEPSVVDLLFDLFRRYVSHRNAEVRQAANGLLIGHELRDEQIRWLIQRHTDSDHALNRLLRYPVTHPLVAAWASDEYLRGAYPERRSELLALSIDGGVPAFAEGEEPLSVLWAIFRARISDEQKENLLLQRFARAAVPVLVEMAHRLRRPRIIEALLERLPTRDGSADDGFVGGTA